VLRVTQCCPIDITSSDSPVFVELFVRFNYFSHTARYIQKGKRLEQKNRKGKFSKPDEMQPDRRNK
jgi:hypothetical protein